MATRPYELPPRATVLDAVLYLMTKHAQSPCPIVQRAIVMHLRLLAMQFSCEDLHDNRPLLRSLGAAWERIASAQSSAPSTEACSVSRRLH